MNIFTIDNKICFPDLWKLLNFYKINNANCVIVLADNVDDYDPILKKVGKSMGYGVLDYNAKKCYYFKDCKKLLKHFLKGKEVKHESNTRKF